MLKENHLRYPITVWLFLCCLLVVAMILLGGATRLTEAGLSIVEWKPLTGIIPPLSKEDWLNAFNHYKQFPEYKLKHMDLTLSDFKFIFYMEYSHRLLGRLLGIVFLLPFLFFWKAYKPALKRRLVVLLCIGGLQGFAGWFMVKSGLVNNPYVSHYRLALHLSLAFILLFLMIEALFAINPTAIPLHRRIKIPSVFSLVAICLTIIYGTFVAGLRAGKLYNTFPKMGDEWIPYEWLFYQPVYINFVENPATVQWVHRLLAFFTAGISIWLIKRLKDAKHFMELTLLLFAVALQILLGIMTVLSIVLVPLALLHQCGAIVLFTYVVVLYFRARA